MISNNNATRNATQAIDRLDIPSEDIEILTSFDRNELPSNNSYRVQFSDTSVTIADKRTVDIKSILEMDSQTVLGFKSTLEAIAINNLRAPVTLGNYTNRIAQAIKINSVKEFTPSSYRQLIKRVSPDTNHAFTSILKTWYRLGYPGLDAETFSIVTALKAPGLRSRKRITSDDPTEGWYTAQEYDDLIDTYWLDYEPGKVNLRDTSALLLMGQYGKRGIQLANLKVCDFLSDGETEGLTGKRVAFPGSKDRSAEDWFRGSKFEIHPLGDDLWNLCMLQIDSTIADHEKHFQRELTEAECNELPFLQSGMRWLKKLSIGTFPIGLSSAVFHLSSTAIARALKRVSGSTVVSLRTGKPVREFAYRMRYTRARQLARLGVPRVTLQYWLGHNENTSLDHYYDDPAEDARLLDLEMQVILAPLAQAFSGTLRDKESDAVRGNNPASRIELDGHHSVGTCGEHGYCNASVPIPCYRCAKFQPWVDAPHEEVLLRLIERQEEENNIHLPSKSRRILVPLQLDKDIAAVKLVIKLCDARKQELRSAAQETQLHLDEGNNSIDTKKKPKAK
jgi:integrase